MNQITILPKAMKDALVLKVKQMDKKKKLPLWVKRKKVGQYETVTIGP
jgi:exosome complex RNA-binding protein Rrp4